MQSRLKESDLLPLAKLPVVPVFVSMIAGIVLGAYIAYQRPPVVKEEPLPDIRLQSYARIRQAISLGAWLGLGATRGENNDRALVAAIEAHTMNTLAEMVIFDEGDIKSRKLVR